MSADGSLVVEKVPERNRLRIWDAARGQMIRELGANAASPVTRISPDGRFLLVETAAKGSSPVSLADTLSKGVRIKWNAGSAPHLVFEARSGRAVLRIGATVEDDGHRPVQ